MSDQDKTPKSHDFHDGSPMERVDFGFDLVQLRHELEKIIQSVPPIMPTESFGGWSLLSRDGSVADGWAQGHLAFSKQQDAYKFDKEKAQEIGLSQWISDFDRRTPLCDGYFGHVLSVIEERGFNPRRARITVIKPGHSTAMHVDGPTDGYSVRLHIPIITNPHCFLEYEDQKIHMPADGNACVIRVNRMHRARNTGTSDRYHLLMDIFDFQGATKFHRFDATKERLAGWRE